jgi:hypothetical protein
MVRKASTKCLVIIILLFCSQVTMAQKRSVSFGNPSPISIPLGAYEPNTFKSLDALPGNIRSKVEGHLRDRFGDEFYSQLTFVAGAIIDVAGFLRVNRNRGKIHSYELVFKYADERGGLKEYYARIRLDSNGDVLDEINLPHVSKHPLKAKIIPLFRAIEIGKEHGFTQRSMGIRIDYDKEAGSLLWIVESFVREDAYRSTRRVLSIDAHSAAILKDTSQSGAR